VEDGLVEDGLDWTERREALSHSEYTVGDFRNCTRTMIETGKGFANIFEK
jgi:hypothetical protein